MDITTHEKLIFSLCHYVYVHHSVFMFLLCKVKTSENNLRYNDITKNQTERLKTIERSLPSGMIFNVVALGEDLVAGDVEVDGIDELQSETVQKYPVYYEKPFHTTK